MLKIPKIVEKLCEAKTMKEFDEIFLNINFSEIKKPSFRIHEHMIFNHLKVLKIEELKNHQKMVENGKEMSGFVKFFKKIMKYTHT